MVDSVLALLPIHFVLKLDVLFTICATGGIFQIVNIVLNLIK